MRLIKILLWLVGVIAVIGIGAVVVLTTLVDPNEYKPRITEAVKAQTGRELVIDGDLELTFFPWLGLATGPLSLSAREGFGDEPMVAVEASTIRVKLMPLLSREVQVDTVILSQPQIVLSRNEDGTSSWDDLLALGQAKSGSSDSGQGGDAAAIAGLAVQGVSIQDGRVSWDDRQSGQRIELSALNLETGTLEPGEPLDIDLKVHVEGNVLPEPADIALTTTVTVPEDFAAVTLEGTALDVALQTMGGGIEAGSLSYGLETGLATASGLAGHAQQNDVRTDFNIDSLSFNQADGSLELPALTLKQEGFELSGSFTGSDLLGSPAASGQFDLKLGELAALLERNQVTVDLGGQRIDALDLSLAFDYAGNGVAVHNLYSNVTANGQLSSLSAPELSVNLDTFAVDLPAFTLSQDDFTASGAFKGVGLAGDLPGMSVAGSLAVKVSDAQTFLARNGLEVETAGVSIGDLESTVAFNFSDGVANVRDLVLQVTANDQPTSAAIPELRLSLADESVDLPAITLEQGDFSLSAAARGSAVFGGLAAMSLAGNVDIGAGNLPDLLARNGLDIELPEGLVTAVNTRLDYDMGSNRLAIDNLEATIDDMTVSGSAGIDDFEAPAYRFDLAIDQLDLDRLAGAGATEESDQPPAGDAEQVLLPVAPLQGLNVDGHLAVGRMKTTGLEFDDVDLTVLSSENVLRIDPLQAKLLGGVIDVQVEYDVSGPAPSLRTASKVDNLDVGALLTTLEITDMVEGTGSISTDVTGTGEDVDALIASLDGQLGVSLLDGAIRGYDLQATLLKLQELYKGESAVSESRPDVKTRFAELSSDFAIDKGVFTTDNLAMKAPVFRVGGRGSMNLPAEKIDFTLDVSVVDSLEGQGGASLENLKGITIPLTISGALAAPSYALDLAGLLKARANQEIKKKLLEELDLGTEAPTGESATGEAATGEGTSAEPAAPVDPKEQLKEDLKEELKKSLFKSLGLD